MKALPLHRWDVTPAEAREIQLQLRPQLEMQDRLPSPIRLVAGADCAFRLPTRRSWESGMGRAIAGVIVYTYPDLREQERVVIETRLTFPYIPGLLSFREIPALLEAFARIRSTPDVIFVDGHGYSHPRRLGIASHLGLVLDCPTIGCAKSVLIGEFKEPLPTAGSWSPLVAPAGKLAEAAETIGAALRTRDSVRPIYVSTGHRVSLPTAIQLALSVGDGFRIPKPTRQADQLVAAAKRNDPAVELIHINETFA
ncbi:MAG TPA: deoxyribonuclease V [Candidatus Acidoferrales bacterium]|nr:deoxyribonuclease V [Candidatus Acidoferrales bacterium]